MKDLYKFVSGEQAVYALSDGKIKFSEIKNLNDPSEMLDFIDTDSLKLSLEDLRKNGVSDYQFEWVNYNGNLMNIISPETKITRIPKSKQEFNNLLMSDVYDNFPYLKKMYVRTVELIRSRVGVFSLTERYDSLPMWAHYGNSGSGFVVKFDNLGELFSNNNAGSLNTLKKVRYSSDLKGMTFDPSTQDDLFFGKFQDWSYEQEWRIISDLSSCVEEKIGSTNLFIKKINKNRIKEVIFGWKISDDEFREIKEKLNFINKEIKITRCVLKAGKIYLC